MGGAAVDEDPHRQHALGLDPDVQIGRLAGDREVAAESAGDERVGGALVKLLGLLVGHAHQAYAHPSLVGDVA